MEKLKMQTADGVQDNISRIAELFPECITEVKTPTGGENVPLTLISCASCCLPIL